MLKLEEGCRNCKHVISRKVENRLTRVKCDYFSGDLLIFPNYQDRCNDYHQRPLTEQEQIADLRYEVRELRDELKEMEQRRVKKKSVMM